MLDTFPPNPGKQSQGERRGSAGPIGHIPEAGTAFVRGLQPLVSYRYCEGQGGLGQGSHGEQLTVWKHGRSPLALPAALGLQPTC